MRTAKARVWALAAVVLSTAATRGDQAVYAAVAGSAAVPATLYESAPLIVRTAWSERVSGAQLFGDNRLLARMSDDRRRAMGAVLEGDAAENFFGASFALPEGAGSRLSVREDDCFNLWDVEATEFDDERETVILTFDVTSPRAHEVVLAVGCSGGFALFVNGRACHVRLPNADYTDSSDLTTIQLRTGRNRVSLLTRASASRSTKLYAPEWVAKIRLFPDRESALATHRRHNRHPVVHPVVTRLEDLRTLAGAPFYRRAQAHVGDRLVADGDVTANGTITWTKRVDVPEGVMVVSIDGMAAEPVVVAKRERLDALRETRQAMEPDPHAKVRGAWTWRFQHLLKPGNRQEDERQWAQKFALSCLGMSYPEQLPALPHSSLSSLGIGAYESALDGATQYYEYFVPRRGLAAEGGREAIPLLIVLPTVADPVRPFLESYYLAGIQEMEAWAAVAEEHGYALLWPGYVDVDFGGALTQRSLAECVRQFRSARHMTVGRIYLMGICSSGVAATQALFEDEFEIGGVCLYSPLVRRSKHRVVQGMRPFTPVRLPTVPPAPSIEEIARQLAQVPAAMLYDSGMPGHGSRVDAYQLIETCRKHGSDLVELKAPTVAEYTWGERMKYRLGLFSKWLVETEARRERHPARSRTAKWDRGGVRDLLIEGFSVENEDSALAEWLAGWDERYFQWRGAALPRGRSDRPARVSMRTIASAADLGPELASRLGRANINPADGELFGIVRRTGSKGEIVVFRNRAAGGVFPAVDPVLDGYFAGAVWRRSGGDRWTQIDVW